MPSPPLRRVGVLSSLRQSSNPARTALVAGHGRPVWCPDHGSCYSPTSRSRWWPRRSAECSSCVAAARRLSAALVLTAGLTFAWYVAAGREGWQSMRRPTVLMRHARRWARSLETFALPSSPRNLMVRIRDGLARTAGNQLQAGGIRLRQIAPTSRPWPAGGGCSPRGVRSSPRRPCRVSSRCRSSRCVVARPYGEVLSGTRSGLVAARTSPPHS